MSDRRTLVYNGETFEYEIMDLLQAALPQAIILHDLHVYSDYLKKNTQIDLVVIMDSGVYVVEAKNWKYWVSGEYDDHTWSGKSRDNKIMQVFNPLNQNFIHIRALRNAMRSIGFEPVIFHNLVVVPDGTTIKSSCSEIVNLSKMVMRMKSLENVGDVRVDITAYKECLERVSREAINPQFS